MSQMNLSRFARPDLTKTVALGECQCPGTPHAADEAEVRADIGDGEYREALLRGGWRSGEWNGSEADSGLVSAFTVSWNLLGADGEPMKVSFASAHLLDEATRDALTLAITASHREGRLPKAPGDPSPDSQPVKGSRRPRAKRR